MPSHPATEITRGQKARASTAATTAAPLGAQYQQGPSQRRRTPQQAHASQALCSQIAQLLHAASQTDELKEDNGNSSRLLHVASDCAGRAALLEWREIAPENDIYDVAALMSAACRVPGDTAGPERTALISEAWDRLLQLTDSDLREDIDDALFAEQPQATARAGLNAEQMEMVLTVIAGEAGTLCDLLLLSEHGGPDARGTAFSAALILAESIGVKADAASGSNVRGDADIWHYGQAFALVGGGPHA